METNNGKQPRLINKKFVLSFSFANYLLGAGGTDKVISEQQMLLVQEDISYVHIAPISTSVKVKDKKHLLFKNLYSVVADGEFYALMTQKQIISYLSVLDSQGRFLDSIFIHHLLNFDLEFLSTILNCYSAPIYFYLHDYYSICVQNSLLKNDKKYCGEDGINEEKCWDCKHFCVALKHHEKMAYFFFKHKKRLSIVSPSEKALDIWLKSYPNLKNQSIVIPHQNLVGEYDKNLRVLDKTDIVKIAFVGSQTIKKGWGVWFSLVDQLNKKKLNYKFYHFGKSTDTAEFINKVSVKVDIEHIDAMTVALRKYQIDCVLLWSIWPETYSYTYFESYASNAYIITNSYSGNMSDMVRKNENGIVLATEEQLMQLLSDSQDLKNRINEFRLRGKKGPLVLDINKSIVKLLSGKKFRFEYPYVRLINNVLSAHTANVMYAVKHRHKSWMK